MSSLNVSGDKTISQTPVSSLDTKELWMWDRIHIRLSNNAILCICNQKFPVR